MLRDSSNGVSLDTIPSHDCPSYEKRFCSQFHKSDNNTNIKVILHSKTIMIGSDWEAFRGVFAEDATLKYCRGSTCTEGTDDAILLPFTMLSTSGMVQLVF